MLELNLIDWIVCVGYILVVFGLAIVSSRGQQYNETYFVGGRKMNWIVVGVSLHHVIMGIAMTHRRTEIMVKISMTMMILGWAALMTGQFANVAFFDQARVTIAPPTWFQAWPTLEFSLLTALQILVIVAGLLLALISLGQVNFRGSTLWTRVGRRVIPLVFIGYSAAVLYLLLF